MIKAYNGFTKSLLTVLYIPSLLILRASVQAKDLPFFHLIRCLVIRAISVVWISFLVLTTRTLLFRHFTRYTSLAMSRLRFCLSFFSLFAVPSRSCLLFSLGAISTRLDFGTKVIIAGELHHHHHCCRHQSRHQSRYHYHRQNQTPPSPLLLLHTLH